MRDKEELGPVLVTGGNGFIGSRVVRILCERGDRVRCLLRETSSTGRIDDLDLERCLGDVRDEASLVEAMRGAGGVIHLASVSSWEEIRSDALEETIVEGTRIVLEAARAAGNLRTVLVSSAAAVNASSTPQVFDESSPFELGDTPLRYSIAKHRAERVALDAVGEGLEVVIVNPAEVYGPDDTGFITAGNLRDILTGWPAIGCTGGTAVVHVEDVAAGMVAAYDRGRSGERYILGGDNLSVEELIRLVLEIAGQKKPVLILPNGLLLALVKGLAFLRLPTPLIPEVLDYATRFFFVDSSKAQRELGFHPRPAREVLEPVVRWLKEAGHF